MVVGSGIVGKATGKGLAKKGHNITFIDIDRKVVKELIDESFNAHTWEEIMTSDIIRPDIVMFCLPTPSRIDGNVDISYLVNAMSDYSSMMKSIEHYHVLCVRSTVPPGTTRNLIKLIEESSSKKVARDFGICMQPEFLRAKSSESDFANPWATIIGEYDRKSGDVLQELYHGWSDYTERTTLETAEFMKYVHNCYNVVKISFANEVWMLGKKLGIDGNKALEMASRTAEGYWNPKYGSVGGHAYGGMCLPKDASGFISFCREKMFEPQLLVAADQVNKIIAELPENHFDTIIQNRSRSRPIERREDWSR